MINADHIDCIIASGQFKFEACKHAHLNSTAVASTRSNCKVIAHRGFSHNAPENTLESVAQSIAAGACACEFDVRCTSDGHVVLMHDLTVDRTTNGTGEIAKMTLAKAQSLDAGSWKSPEYIGEKIPTLAEVFQLMSQTNQQAVVEIKDSKAATGVAILAQQYSMTKQVIALSEDPEILQQIKSIEPNITRALLCIAIPKEIKRAGKEIEWLMDQEQKASAQVIDIDYRLTSPQLIAALHRQNIETWVWTVNSPEIMKCLIDWQIDAIASDKPDLLKATLKNAPSRFANNSHPFHR